MRILIAPDSFKESMTAKEAADAIETGIKKVIPNADCVKVPMADGGEGTTQSLVDATQGKLYEVEVLGPLGSQSLPASGCLATEKQPFWKWHQPAEWLISHGGAIPYLRLRLVPAS